MITPSTVPHSLTSSPQLKHLLPTKMQRLRFNPKSPVSTQNTTLNDLPTDLLRHIITFLPSTLDVVTTTLISRKWRGLWRSSLTSLNFDQDDFHTRHHSLTDTIFRFAEFVNKTLQLRQPSAPLINFIVRYAYVSIQCSEFVDDWIDYAVSNGAVCLDVDLNRENYEVIEGGESGGEGVNEYSCGDEDYETDGDESHEMWYDFEFEALGVEASCVASFKLRESKLLMPDLSLVGGLRFGTIKSILLDKVYMTDKVVSDLMECCVSLEGLELSRIYGVEDMKLRSFTLREMSLKHWDLGKSVEIIAPKLKRLIMAAFEAEEYIFTDVSGLVEARITSIYYEDWSKVVRLLTNVQHLVVQNSWFELLLSERLLSESFKFPNLKELQLRTGYSIREVLGLGAVLECCPNLETLALLTLSNWFEEENIPKEFFQRPNRWHFPCLKHVLVHNYMNTDEERQVVNLLKEQGDAIQDAILSRADESEVPRKSIKQPFGQLDYLIADMLESIF